METLRGVTITSNMIEAVIAALRAVHPKGLILICSTMASPMRYAARPEVAEGVGAPLPLASGLSAP
jgi:hypothetical protein